MKQNKEGLKALFLDISGNGTPEMQAFFDKLWEAMKDFDAVGQHLPEGGRFVYGQVYYALCFGFHRVAGTPQAVELEQIVGAAHAAVDGAHCFIREHSPVLDDATSHPLTNFNPEEVH